MFQLLRWAILDIRVSVGGGLPVSEAARQRIFVLANMAHNWPEALQHAKSDEDYDAILREAWRWRTYAEEWMRGQLLALGVDPADLE